MSPLPNNVWERSSRASGECSGEGRPSKPAVQCKIGCAVGPHPDEAYRARPTSPQLRSGEVTCTASPLSNNVRERSSRASGECSGEGRPSKPTVECKLGCAVGPHPNEA
ncbi:hypothetical protein Rcae01_00524 [Novipirellula caenicola]|uniref:Uncharacterized protein n=1 Tax=Novipirellula caenicola TaxID=1536901 RepID=A0ABP9VLP6_9BACT